MAVLRVKGAFVLWLHVRIWARCSVGNHLCVHEQVNPPLPCLSQSLAGYVDFTAPGVTSLPHLRKSAYKVGPGPCQQFKAQQPSVFQPCRHRCPQNAKFLLVRWWVQLPNANASTLLGSRWGSSQGAGDFWGSALAFLAPHCHFQPHNCKCCWRDDSAACEAVSKPCHFTAQCKSALSSIYFHMPAKNGASSDASQSSESLSH